MNISYSVYLYFYFDNVILVLDKKKVHPVNIQDYRIKKDQDLQ